MLRTMFFGMIVLCTLWYPFVNLITGNYIIAIIAFITEAIFLFIALYEPNKKKEKKQ